MTRRKQNCPKRMKWEGGEGGEEDAPDSPGSKGDDGSSSVMSPNSLGSQDDDASCLTPDHPPTSPSPMPLNGQDDYRDGPGSRCPSRDSRGSSIPRCGSRESLCSDRIMSVAMPAMSPMSVNLPATLGPSAANALLPPHSAAIAAYIAAGQHRLLMTSPLPPGMPRGSVSPLVSSSSSPPMLPLGGTVMSPPPVPRIRSPIDTDSAALDFSTKRGHSNKSHRDDDGDSILNLSKPPTPTEMSVNSPLDLSCSGRKRPLEDSSPMSLSLSSLSPSPHPPARKSSRMSSDYKPVVSPWTSPVVASHFPYFAAAVAAASSLSPKSNHTSSSSHGEQQLWNGKMKSHDKQGSHFSGMPTPSDATKALEKMSELSKLGGDDLFRPSMNSGNVNSGGSVSATGRHSAWQSHWLNKGAEQAKDVLKCVWCKQSFPSLAAMTVHMKDAKHCGVNVPTPIQPPPPPPQHQHQHQPPTSSPSSHNRDTPSSNHHSGRDKPSAAELNLLIKETMPLPRKLVRGQDVWLGKGAEQTRQILKCMWCGQSFRSLAEMTNHMQQTQHYTNIISQEQIISWKSSDDVKPGGPGGGPNSGAGGGTSSHVSAVLTCKVCDQAFSSLKELSNHMVKNSHYKEHIMRSITESGGRRRQTREKRKKSLPVRKLLELERAQHEMKNGDGGMLVGGNKIMRESSSAGRITCEKCGEKIETSIFVDHIRQCVGGGVISTSQRNLLKNALLSINVLPPDHHVSEREGRKSVDDPVPASRHHRSPSLATDLTSPSSGKESVGPTTGDNSAPSVLNAIEKLIEKSFDSRARHGSAAGYPGVPGVPGNAPMGSSILKRLGIDESVDYTKPLVDAQTMNILRSYHHHQQSQQHHYNRRERSGSESSSMSERGVRHESLTPDRKLDSIERLMSSTPRTTPEKRIQTPPSAKSSIHDDSADEHVIKKESMTDDERHEDSKIVRREREVAVKKEIEDGDADDDDRASYHSGPGVRPKRDDVPLTPASVHDAAREDDVDQVHNSSSSRRSSSSVGAPSPGLSPRRTPPGVEAALNASSPRTCSPASSERSGTPRSTNGIDKKAAGGSSLGALSSMFDNLSGGGGGAGDGSGGGGRKPSSHPLAALQKLCDKTERHGGNGNNRSGGNTSAGGASGNHATTVTTTSSQGGNSSNPGSILAFSWACNDAVMTSDSIMKCAFCDTPFISKGAYRHHLSKMHFVKDGAIPDPVSLKAHQQANSDRSTASTSSAKGNGTANNNNNNGTGINNSGASGSSGKSPNQATNFEESPHSKFLKYTELAKQLSSKYV